MDKIVVQPVQWASVPDIDDVVPIDDKDFDVLNDIRTVLEKHNYTERFGICLLHRHFDLSSAEVLMEYTDKDRRVSEIVVERDTEPSKTKIQTMWKLSKDIKAATECRLMCEYAGGHRRVHKKVGV